MKKELAPLLIIIAGCLWGAMGLFVRKLNGWGIESMDVVFVRALLTAVITFAITAIYDRKQLKIRLRDVWIFAGTGLFSIVMFNYCYFSAMSVMSLSAAAILLYTSPIFVMLMSAVFFKERITVQKIIAVFVSLAGLCLVTGVFGGATITPAGIALGLLSAVGYALYSIFGRAAIDHGYSSLTMTSWSFAFAAVFSAFLTDYGAIGAAISASPVFIPYSVLFAVVVSVAPYLLYSAGLKGTETGKAAVIASVEPVAASVFGAVVFHEIPSVYSVLGILLVLAALVLCIAPSGNRPKKANGK